MATFANVNDDLPEVVQGGEVTASLNFIKNDQSEVHIEEHESSEQTSHGDLDDDAAANNRIDQSRQSNNTLFKNSIH